MITSPKAKAYVAAILTFIAGLLNQVQAVSRNGWDASTYYTLAIWVVANIGVPLGVFFQENAAPADPAAPPQP